MANPPPTQRIDPDQFKALLEAVQRPPIDLTPLVEAVKAGTTEQGYVTTVLKDLTAAVNKIATKPASPPALPVASQDENDRLAKALGIHASQKAENSGSSYSDKLTTIEVKGRTLPSKKK